MSLTGAFVIAAICLARLALKKIPKMVSYCLWAVAGFRLIVPVSIESVFSLIPFNTQAIPTDIVTQPIAEAMVGGNPLQIWITIGLAVWLTGVAVMLAYGAASYLRLKRKLKSAICIEANIYETNMIKTTFVLGLFVPKIYLPVDLTKQERDYILLHEQIHISRRDNIVKFAACLILCIHWFNPLVWLAFRLMGMDMEMSCDERVLKELGEETKKGYSMALLSLATERRIIGGTLLAFGGSSIHTRISNILNLKKQSRTAIAVLMALVLVFGAGLSVNSVSVSVISPYPAQYDVGEETDAVNVVFERWQCCDES